MKAGREISLGVWEQGWVRGSRGGRGGRGVIWDGTSVGVCGCVTLPRAVYGPKEMLWRDGGGVDEWMRVDKWSRGRK